MVFSDPRQDCLGGIAGAVVLFKIDMLKTSLLGDQLREKVYVTLSFYSSFGVFKPWWVAAEIEVRDGIYTGVEESFDNELTHALTSVFVTTEAIHIKNFDRRAVVDDLPE